MKLKDAIKQLDIKTKAQLITGRGFWDTAECKKIGMPSAKVSDGPTGMRVQQKRPKSLGVGKSLPATCYPTASAAACSFDEELCFELGKHIALEGAEFGVSMVLGPGLNIKRSPLCGRNFEYFSEDGYLSGKIAAAYVKGIQSVGLTACIKHFAVNCREYARMYYDVRADEQTLRETYLTGFEIAVKEGGAGAVMTAYNMLNGEYCNQNKWLINDVLRGEWGFDGLVISDWGGSHSRVKSLAAGADLEMPECKFSAREVVAAVNNGLLSESVLDRSVGRIYKFAHSAQKIERQPFRRNRHDDFACKVAENCMVLLKNNVGALPLKKHEYVAVIGDLAKKPRYQGAGSSQVNPTFVTNLVTEVKKSRYLDYAGYAKGYTRSGRGGKSLIKSAVKLANKADTVIVCVGLDENSECEGCDRDDIVINQNQIELLQTLHQTGKKIIAVLMCGSVVDVEWECYTDALLLAHLGGQSSARAAVRIITGKVNPSGRLAETYIECATDAPCSEVYRASDLKCDLPEGLYVGYKYYSSMGVRVKYPFGYGLSYTQFDYSDMSVSRAGVKVRVSNVGKADGATVVQVYVTAPRPDLHTQFKELKLFKKIFLKTGESQEIFMPFDGYSFRMWNPLSQRFEAGGVYKVEISENCNKPLYAAKVTINKENLPSGCSELSSFGPPLDYEDYFALRISPDKKGYVVHKGMQPTLDMQVADLKYCKGLLAKIFARIVVRARKSKSKMRANALEWTSVRSLTQFMGLNAAQVRGFLIACDGHLFKGLKLLLKKK